MLSADENLSMYDPQSELLRSKCVGISVIKHTGIHVTQVILKETLYNLVYCATEGQYTLLHSIHKITK